MMWHPDDIETTADEYVLGLLDAAEAAQIEANLAHDADLARRVALARERFLPLDTSVEPVGVSPSLWDAISGSLPDNRVAAAEASPARPRIASAGNDNVRSRWRTAALSAMAASVVLVGGLAWSLTRTVEPLVVAVLLDEGGDVRAVVEDFGNETAAVRLLSDFVVPTDKTMQVWTLASADAGPQSMGLLTEGHSATLHGPVLPRPRDRQLYEITLEQAGGSPTGRPTGPILAKGFAKPLR